MFKKYNPKLIHSYLTYKISDICRVYKAEKLHPQTIRKWINKGGLDAFSYKRDLYIYGAVLKKFLTDRNKKNKDSRKLSFEQFRCGKCKNRQAPQNNVITKLTTGRNNCILAYGICSKCNHLMNRPYKQSELEKIHKIFNVMLDEVARLYGCSSSTNKTHPNDIETPLDSECINILNKENSKNNVTSTNKTKQTTILKGEY